MYNLCKNLPKNSYAVITIEKEFSKRFGVYDKNYELDCTTARLPVCYTSTRDQLVFLLLTVLKGLSIRKKDRFDCILAVHPYFCDLIGAYILHKLTGTPFVIYMHDLFSETRRSAPTYGIWYALEKRIFRSASKILIMNEHYRYHYSKKGVQNTVIFPPSIDLASYYNSEIATASPILPKNKLVIAYTGSVYSFQEKAILAFLDAAKRVSGIHVVFATPSAEGYLEESLRELLKEVDIGFLSKKNCMALQKRADVLFLPLSQNLPYSEEEKVAFPCKLLEYLAAGKAILAVVPKGSFVESFVLEHEVGVIVNTLSVEKIVNAIVELKDEDARRRFSQNSLRTAKLFDAKIWAQRLYILLSEVTSQ